MLRRGLVEGTAGNISARRSDGNVVIAPSSVDYARCCSTIWVKSTPAVRCCTQDGRSRRPANHLTCYRAFDDGVIHSRGVGDHVRRRP